MDEPIINETVVKEIGETLLKTQELLKQGLMPLEIQIDRAIKEHTTDKKRLDTLFDNLMDYTQIEEGLVVFKRLCQYCYPIYADLAASYIKLYQDLYDPEYSQNN